MGTWKKSGGQQGRGLTATELVSEGKSETWQKGRRVKLFFREVIRPELDRIEYHYDFSAKFGFLQQGLDNDPTHRFNWSEMAKGLSLCFLDYRLAAFNNPTQHFAFRGNKGSPAAWLANAISQTNGKLYDLFVEYPAQGGKIARVRQVFDGVNLHGKDGSERLVMVNDNHLPPECVEIEWERQPLQRREAIQVLADALRKAWNLPPSSLPIPPFGEELAAEPPVQPCPPEPIPEKENPEPAPPRAKAEAPPVQNPEPTATPPEPKEAESANEPDVAPNFTQPPQSETPPIDPHLFTVPASNGYWPDSAPLLGFGQDEEYMEWTLQNAFEGVLIMGTTGSGKTSGSGSAIAEAFLYGGFGGLVLTVKKGEAEHWGKLCRRCGRENDLIVVQRGGRDRLNILAYEAQRPGEGGGHSENLIAFCRNLLKVGSRSKGGGNHDPIWENAGDHLLAATFDLFILAGVEITFDRFSTFISSAPGKPPTSEAEWAKTGLFGSVMARARKLATKDEDQRLLARAEEYWLNVYPSLGSRTRSSVTLGVFSMLNAFRGRDIPALVASETNLTPECIMAGKIVVLDLPLKEFDQTGLLIQSAWKYLFQKAVERQNRAGDPRQRPVFIWEDEGQYFFSDHDSRFQDTARSSRVSRVILTQNLHSFYKEFGRDGVEAANNVFGNLNTKIFHANNDRATNEWASALFGSELHHRVSINNSPAPQPRDFLEAFRQSINPPSTTGFSMSEHWEPAVRPEEFNKLRTGGHGNGFMVDAYISWLGLCAERERHFTKVTFNQNA